MPLLHAAPGDPGTAARAAPGRWRGQFSNVRRSTHRPALLLAVSVLVPPKVMLVGLALMLSVWLA